MLFNSLGYAAFLIIVFFLYWFPARRSLQVQNTILLVSSYVFYGSWDWRFLFLLAFSTLLDFYTGLKIHQAQTKNKRKIWLTISIAVNIGFLCFFKYFNFFTQSFADMLHRFDLQANMPLLEIILPVGISFYTFHGLSYVFDIYREKITPTTNYIDYSLFVSFFPLLVAGPIERATHLLPQVKAPRSFSNHQAIDGLRQILWGLFKKVVIADNCAMVVNEVFAHPESYSSASLIAGAVLFAFQIYGDFSGYTDIALGSARLFGFDLLRNFNYPYFSRDIAEFWRRWHISLTSWFKDYVYIPLGGNRGSKMKTLRNTIVVFLLSGLWHGANWTFIIWGAYHALLFLPLLLLNQKKRNINDISAGRPSMSVLLSIVLTFALVTIGWIIFRADSLSQAGEYYMNMFAARGTNNIFDTHPETTIAFIFIALLLMVEWRQKNRIHGLAFEPYELTRVARYAIYCGLIICIMWFAGRKEAFIYFQF